MQKIKTVLGQSHPVCGRSQFWLLALPALSVGQTYGCGCCYFSIYWLYAIRAGILTGRNLNQTQNQGGTT
ncbi:hypothetical protein CBFG_05227 [Clostridiales bacterium 1_7_47FAA]|nr:hypothetical protein CBFG_05227 [Clostridiales bacterium 1_7_47FAA]